MAIISVFMLSGYVIYIFDDSQLWPLYTCGIGSGLVGFLFTPKE